MDTRSQAQEAQDRIGWANQTDPEEMGFAMLELARVVVQLARDVAALERKLAIMQAERTTRREDLGAYDEVYLPGDQEGDPMAEHVRYHTRDGRLHLAATCSGEPGCVVQEVD